MPHNIAVIGCGPAGQAAAILLAEQGHRVTVFERAQEVGPIGAGLLLQPTGLAVLQRLGVAENITRHAARVQTLFGANIRNRPVLKVRYADLDQHLVGLGVQRSLISAALLGRMNQAGVELRTDAEVERIETHGHHTTLSTAGGKQGPFDLTIIADGSRSAHRHLLGKPKRDRQYPWGALWRIDNLDFLDSTDGINHKTTLRQTYHGTRSMIGFLPSGSIPDEAPKVSMFWSIRVRDWQGHDCLDLDRWKRDARHLAPYAERLIDRIEQPQNLIFANYRDVVLRQPYRGSIVAIGDAAHAMSPQLGQGVNLAFVDAAALADALAEASDIPAALAAFARVTGPRNRFYGFASRRLTPIFQSDANWITPLRDACGGTACRFPYLKRQALLSLCGLKTGLFSSDRLTPTPHAAQLRTG